MANLRRNNKILRAGVLGNEWISLPRARLGKSLPPRWMDSNPEAAGWGRVTVVPPKARERHRVASSAHRSPWRGRRVIERPRLTLWKVARPEQGWPGPTALWERAFVPAGKCIPISTLNCW